MSQSPLKLLVDDPKFDMECIIEEKNANSPQSLYLQGPFLMSEEKNKNGRIYPLAEMQVEVQRYVHEMVDRKRALGELNHPTCCTKEVIALTSDGWKSIVDITTEDEVYTLNPTTNNMELQKVVRKIDEPYAGKMIQFKGRNIDLTVTPNHKIPLVRRNGTFELVEAREIFNNRSKYNKSYIPKTANPYVGESTEFITIPGISNVNPNLYKDYDPTMDLKIKTDVFVKFLGFWLAEGYTETRSTIVGISQNSGKTLDDFKRDVIQKFPSDVIWREKSKQRINEHVSLTTRDIRLYNYLKKLGKCYDKYIPTEIKSLDGSLLEELLFWYNKGDGRDQETWGGYRIKNNFTTSERLVYDLSELQVKCGLSGNINTIISEADYTFADRTIKAENKVPLYELHQSTTRGIYLDERFLEVSEIDFDDRVYCIEVPNNTFYVMENGKACWTGNSVDVNPERASHLITKMWQEGNLFYGKAKVLNTPIGNVVKSLVMEGVQLGVSSRALGKLTPSNGGNMVSNLHLVCVDVVHDPSAPKSFVDGILESKSWIINPDGSITEALDKFANGLETMPIKNRDDYLRSLILGFLNNVK